MLQSPEIKCGGEQGSISQLLCTFPLQFFVQPHLQHR